MNTLYFACGATAQNNFSEAIFEKINERSFSYAFKLIARNKDEAQDIQKIIKFFKFHMHPELDMANGGRIRNQFKSKLRHTP